ncbi:hypothetical protein SY83_03745 [Paenibacillus swuensis]|uniref:Lipoprotein n=1 Tax=Paenibacillus swuensis TaxID=1178515 RepID=A0A172TES1_9BACL|nr:hypothetical protein [Paenibacillus swuensis]ANE45565.1 hypothetical protein SY83_03745 [Paenibacillus swuensis]
MNTKKLVYSVVVSMTMTLVISACTQEKKPEKPVTPVVQNSDTTKSITVFQQGIQTYDGTEYLKGPEGTATFRKALLLPYGFYMPEGIEEYKLKDGTEWGSENQRNLFSLFEQGQVPYKPNVQKESLAKYKEYKGTESNNGISYDYFEFTHEGRSLLIRLRYPEQDQETMLPVFLGMMNSIRFVTDSGKAQTSQKPVLEAAWKLGFSRLYDQ